MNLKILRLAQRDLDQAADYYRAQRQGLEIEFLNEIDSAFLAIASAPFQFAQVRPGIRCYLLDRFPYGVYYRVPADDEVQIVVVKHHRRRPDYGMGRK